MFKTLHKESTSGRKAKIPTVLLLLIGVCLVFSIAITAKVRYTGGDSYLSLLVSQSILQNHTIKLDDYYWNENFQRSHNGISIKNGHAYDWHPLGTSIFSIPAVWIANLAGRDMLSSEDYSFVQIAIAAVLCSLIFVLVFKIAGCWLPPVPAFVISIVSFFGTSYATMATALWSFDFEIFFLCLGFLLLARYQTDKRKSINPCSLGFFLFSAYFCRPSASIFILLALLYILAFKRDIFFKTALTAGSLLLAFMFFSYHEYHQILPDYYLLGSNLGFKTFWLGLYSNTFGPSRGIFVFSPFLLLVLAATIIYFKNLRKNPLFWFALAWFILHLLTLSAFAGWWFGLSYGPRTFADGFLSLIVLTVFAWHEISKSPNKIYKEAFLSGYFLLAFLAVFINTKQGLYNTSVQEWCTILDLNRHPKYVLDWKFPQFLASDMNVRKQLNEYRIARYGPPPDELPAYHPGEDIPFNGKQAVFKNFIAGPSCLMTTGDIAAIIFRLDDLAGNTDYNLYIKAGASLPVAVGINGFVLDFGDFSDGYAYFVIPREMLLENSFNIIEFKYMGEVTGFEHNQIQFLKAQDNQAPNMNLSFQELGLYKAGGLVARGEARDITWFTPLLPSYKKTN